jgi:cytochrome c-type biogenesis protein CcmH
LLAPILLLILLFAVALLVAAYVIRPLLRKPQPGESMAGATTDPAAEANLMVLRDRRRELDASLANLPADSPERVAAMDELARQTAAELDTNGAVATERQARSGTRRQPLAAALVASLLVIPAFLLYLLAGSPESLAPEMQASQDSGPTLDQMADRLRERLAGEPDRADGWQLLGRTELARGRFDAAVEALERAAALEPRDAGVKVDLADAIAQRQGAQLEGRPIELIREALAIDPNHQKGLALSGAWSVSRQDIPSAIGSWERLLAQLPPGSPQARQLEGYLADLRAGRPPGAGQDDAVAAAPGPSAADGTTGASRPGPPNGRSGGDAGPASTAVRGTVEIAPPLAARAQPGDTLFVVARALDEQGRPAGPPVALMTARAGDLPLSFSLDDSMAMMPSARLSGASRVAVVARLSRTGEATVRTGDLQGASPPVAPGATGVRVLIDTVVP